jgi:Ni/Co efflux regulator RcnB
VKAKKSAATEAQRKSSGTKLVEKYRRQMSRLSDHERQKLMARGLQIIYGDTVAAQSAHRG